jgi:pilus assembly protein CpaB
MTPRTLGLLFFSLALAAAAGYSNWRYLVAANEPGVATSAPAALRDVVVARNDLAVSEQMNSLMLTVVQWPEELAPKGSFEHVEDVVERIPRRRFTPGEPILEAGLFAEGALGGLSPLIQTGLRAMSVQVDEIIGIAGFVTVGSTVDVLATLRRTVESEAFSQVILQDVRVLAVDRTLEPRKADSDERISVVTLEVTPTQAKKLAFASSQGSIQLALRNPADAEMATSSSVGAPHLRGEVAKLDETSRVILIVRGLERSFERFLYESADDARPTAAARPAVYGQGGSFVSVAAVPGNED